ncbi:MAG TPA: DUF6174 domain-containing protein [Gemmatimonadaceae bacterium]|nr:DUF6174 domain-containing protein [Gemmatimonadaceae bacterium]
MRRSLPASLRLVAVVAFALIACKSTTTPQGGLANARARWAARGPDSYAVTVTRSCECMPEASGSVRVTVRSKTVESRVYTSSGAAVAARYAPVFPSVEELFVMIDAAIRRGASVQVQYDPTSGYPTRFAEGDPAVDAPLLVLTDLSTR